MEVEFKHGIYFISGDITETCDLVNLNIPSGNNAKFDLGGVRTINSCGVREWIKSINKQKISPIYMNCPQSVVMQFNMVKEFLGTTGKIDSFQVPAYCVTCGEQKIYLLRSGREFNPGEKLEFELAKCDKDNCAIEADVDFESYFYFIENLRK